MPRLPVDGNKVVEHRITLGTYEREQLNRFVDGMQVRNIGQGFGAATDPLEALFNTTTGTVGGAFAIAWALKRFFGVDVPIPTDWFGETDNLTISLSSNPCAVETETTASILCNVPLTCE